MSFSADMEIFRSDNIVVKSIDGFGDSDYVITFDSYTDTRDLQRSGFAEKFLRDRQINAIHVLSVDNDWYQYEEIFEALNSVRSALPPSASVLTYGSSMGGYAAIKFADAVGASRVLALSPQFTLDPKRISFEPRWAQEARRIAWRPEIDGRPIATKADVVVVFDPTDLDRHHTDLIERDIPIRRLAIRYAGHPAGGYLQECGLLGEIVLQHLSGRLDHGAMARTVRKYRTTSSSYLSVLSNRQPKHRRRLALRLAERSIATAPNSAPAFATLAQRLMEAQRFAEAIAAHRRVLELSGRAPVFLHHFSYTLFMAGDYQQAYEIGHEVIEAMPSVAHHHHWMAHMLAHERRFQEALEFSQASLALDPGNEQYAAMLQRLQGGLLGRGARALRRWLQLQRG